MPLLKSNYKFLKEYNLTVEYHSGKLDLDSYINFVTRTIHDPLFSPNTNYLIDLRNVVVITSIDDISKYNDFIEDNLKCERKRKIALLTETPNQMVFSTIFKNNNTQKLKEIEVFSTPFAATEWLNSNLNKNEILDVLNKLMLV